MAARKRKNPMEGSYKFNKQADIGPQDYATMDPAMAKTIHEERIRRQVRSRIAPPPKGKK